MAYRSAPGPRLPSLVRTSRNAELIFAANIVATASPQLASQYETWIAAQLKSLGPGPRGFLAFARTNLEWATLSFCDYLQISGFYDDWEALAAYAQAQATEDFLQVLFNRDLGPATILECLREPEAASKATRDLASSSKVSPSAAQAIFSDPHGFRSSLLSFIASMDTEAFRSALKEAEGKLQATARHMEERLRAEDPLEIVRDLIEGFRINAEDLRGLSLVPSYFVGRPNLASYREGNLEIYFSGSAGTAKPTEGPRELASTLKVLGDGTRLEILRRLAEGPSYCKELASWLALSPATVSRQLDQLKAAGLVEEEEADPSNIKRVHLAPAALAGLFARLQGFLRP